MGKKLSSKTFYLSQVIILIFGLAFLAGLYYILNIHAINKPANSFSAGPVTSAPATVSLDLSSPDDNTLTFSGTTLVSGKTTPGFTVLITGEADDQIVEAKTDGNFSVSLKLQEGVNNITVATFDKTGDEKSISRTVYYSKEKI